MIRNYTKPKILTQNSIKTWNFQNFEMTFPIDDSVMTCYKERTSCVENDFPKEVNFGFLFKGKTLNCVLGSLTTCWPT